MLKPEARTSRQRQVVFAVHADGGNRPSQYRKKEL
jgi:hypothetical protein